MQEDGEVVDAPALLFSKDVDCKTKFTLVSHEIAPPFPYTELFLNIEDEICNRCIKVEIIAPPPSTK